MSTKQKLYLMGVTTFWSAFIYALVWGLLIWHFDFPATYEVVIGSLSITINRWVDAFLLPVYLNMILAVYFWLIPHLEKYGRDRNSVVESFILSLFVGLGVGLGVGLVEDFVVGIGASFVVGLGVVLGASFVVGLGLGFVAGLFAGFVVGLGAGFVVGLFAGFGAGFGVGIGACFGVGLLLLIGFIVRPHKDIFYRL